MNIAKQKMRLVSKDNLTGTFWLLKFDSVKPFKFSAGQYISLKVDEQGHRRSYSIASSPSQSQIELLIDVSPMGIGSRYVLGLKQADEVEILGPLGRFGINGKLGKKLFVATGCGIVPLRSMTLNLLETNHSSQKHLVWGLRHETDLFWQEEFIGLTKKHPDFSYDIILSRPDQGWRGKRGHVNDVLKQTDWSDWEVYLCGNQEMISQLTSWFSASGLSQSHIYVERFY